MFYYTAEKNRIDKHCVSFRSNPRVAGIDVLYLFDKEQAHATIFLLNTAADKAVMLDLQMRAVGISDTNRSLIREAIENRETVDEICDDLNSLIRAYSNTTIPTMQLTWLALTLSEDSEARAIFERLVQRTTRMKPKRLS